MSKEWKRINPKNNIINFIPRLFWRIMNSFKYQKVYFFDTNMIIRKKEESNDGRLKFVNKNLKIITSDIFSKEADNLIATGRYKRILNGDCSVISFEDLRSQSPDNCPLYYNYIHAIFNPANIASPTFWKERYLAAKIGGEIVFPQEELLNRIVSQKIDRSKNNKISIFGEEKDENSKFVDNAIQKYYQKKIKAIKRSDQNYYNDIKSLALALLWCVRKRVNVNFFTSDSDMVIHFRNWLDSVSHQSAIKYFVLQFLESEKGQSRIWGGRESATYGIPFKEYAEFERNFMADFLGLDWKKSGYYFQIHSWDEGKNKYVDDIKINFNAIMEENLLNLHGPLSCPFVSNNTGGNFFAWRYIWPPLPTDKPDIIKITVIPKKYRNFRSQICSFEDHKKVCVYAQMDDEKDLKYLSGFKWDDINDI